MCRFVAGLTRMQNIGWDVFKMNVIKLSSMESGYVMQDDMVFV